MIARLAIVTAVVLVVAAAVPAGRAPDIHGEWVHYAGAGGDSVRAYLAFPERPDPAPAVSGGVRGHRARPALAARRHGRPGRCPPHPYATHNAALRVVVVCCGSGPGPDAVGRIAALVFGVYGENDARINAGIPDIERAMAAGKRYTKTVYPGAGHAFLRTREPAAEAERAWRDIVAFLATARGGPE